MNTIDAIMTRRSIRQYTDAEVTDDQIKTILAAGMQAPSSGDGRPWYFIVTKDKAKLAALAEKVDNGNAMIKDSQAAILLCIDYAKEGFEGFAPQDCACAAQNMQLAAHDIGLATVWVACWKVPPRVQGCQEVFDIPEGIEPFALFPLGENDEHLPAEDRWNEALVSYQ